MGFNNGFEHVRLENKWKKLRIQYREAGMSEEAIQEMYNFDVQVVNSEQRYYRHPHNADAHCYILRQQHLFIIGVTIL